MKLVFAAALSLVLGVVAARTVHSQAEPLPLQMGFVDVDRILQEYRKCQTMDQEVLQRREALNADLKERRQQIEAKHEKLAPMTPGSDEFVRLQREVDIELLTWKRDKDYGEEQVAREHNKRLGEVYREICNEARAQAEARGLAAVLAYDPLTPGVEARTPARVLIQNRDVLWSDGRLDLTPQVIQALNSQLPPAAPLPPVQPGSGGK